MGMCISLLLFAPVRISFILGVLPYKNPCPTNLPPDDSHHTASIIIIMASPTFAFSSTDDYLDVHVGLPRPNHRDTDVFIDATVVETIHGKHCHLSTSVNRTSTPSSLEMAIILAPGEYCAVSGAFGQLKILSRHLGAQNAYSHHHDRRASPLLQFGHGSLPGERRRSS